MHCNRALTELMFVAGWCLVTNGWAQSPPPPTATVTGVYGSFLVGGAPWNSTTNSSVNAPNDRNNLLAFTTSDGTFATGVQDSLVPSATTGPRFQAIAPSSLPIVQPMGDYLIGVGQNYGGSPQTAVSNIVTGSAASLTSYLTDGSQGLDLMSGLFNIPATTARYPITIASPTFVTDTQPDIIVTQIGLPGGAQQQDVLSFVDASGNLIGNAIRVDFSGVPSVGLQNWAFFEAAAPHNWSAVNTLVNTPSRDLRMLALKLSDFGINAGNFNQVAQFSQQLNGFSDTAFVAYNEVALAMPPLDLGVSATATATSVEPGGSSTITITVTNTLAVDATGASVSIPLPGGLGLSSASSSVGNYMNGVWQIGNLAAGQSASLELNVIVSATSTVPANIDVARLNFPDTNPSNNVTSVTLTATNAPIVGTVAPVPSVSIWGLGILAALFSILGVRRSSRRSV